MDAVRVPAKSGGLRFARRFLQALEGLTSGSNASAASTPERTVSNGPQQAPKPQENGTTKPPRVDKSPVPPPRRSERVLQADKPPIANGKTRASKRARVAAAVAALTEEPMELLLFDEDDDDAGHAPPARTQRTRPPPTMRKQTETSPKQWTLDARRDVLLLREVVEVLQLDDTLPVSDAMWQQLRRVLAHKGGAVVQADDPKKRMQWLSRVWRDTNHPDHGKLTPAMQHLLNQYTHKTTPPSPPLTTLSPTPSPATLVLDRWLLGVLVHEALRRKPFLTNEWERVAAAVNTQANTTVFPNGESCRRHVVTLLSGMDSANAHEVEETTGVECRLLKVLAVAMDVQWPERDGILTNEQQDFLKKMDTYLNPDEANKGDSERQGNLASETEEKTNVEDKAEDERLTETNEGVVMRQTARDVSELTVRPVRPGPGRRGPSPHMPSPARGKRRRSEVEYENTSGDDSPSVNRLVRLQTDLMERLQAESDARRRLEVAIKEERSEWRDERTRLQHALNTMSETLTAERLAQREETKAMLGVIEREREDRRSEFVAMMNLVTRAMATPSPSPCQRSKRNGENGNGGEPTI